MSPGSISRRSALRLLPAAFAVSALSFGEPELSAHEQFAAIEIGIGGRLGVAALDTGSGHRLGYRETELFAMCSTFKFLLAACILGSVDAGKLDLSRRISYGEKDLLGHAPVTRAHVAEGVMAIGDLCAAAVEESDNTAANLLLGQIGGPPGLTEFIRSLGNQVTRLDRTEPELNTVLPGDPRDTTSPMAMVDSMQKLLLGDALSAPRRAQLVSWMERSTTGKNRLRAGIPTGWRAGDKTGTGDYGAAGDVGIFWPPGKAPILIAAYVMEGKATTEEQERAIAAVGRIVAGIV